ncbi:probable metal-nicotianamine transporter YSL7, partial [Tanacetum coccineum]
MPTKTMVQICPEHGKRQDCSSLQESKQVFFDFSATYVGVGMICPYLINISLLVREILSWGVMWPLISERKGDCFEEVALNVIRLQT